MSRRADLLLLLACIAAWAFATVRVRGALATVVVAPMPADVRSADRATVIHDVSRIARQGAFRPLGGRPPAPIDTAVSVAPPMLELPQVQLKAVMGGPPWHAVLSLTGSSGEDRVLRAGDSLATIAVRAVRKDGVTLQFRDTTWTITLREERRP